MFGLRPDQACADPTTEQHRQNGEADAHRNVDPEGRRDHLEGNPSQDARQRPGESPELVGHRLVDEEQGPKTQDRHDVGRVGDEPVGRDRQDGGNAVDREDDVGDLDQDDHTSHQREDAPAVDLGRQLVADELRMDRHEPVDDLPAPLLGHLDLFVEIVTTARLLEGLPCGPHQDQPEDHADPLELLEQFEARHDEDQPEHDGPGDAVVQHPTFELRLHLEAGEDQTHHEQVVEAEGLLQGPGGEVLPCRLMADEDEHGDGEQQRDADVEHRPPHCLGELDDVILLGVVRLDECVSDEDRSHQGVHEPGYVERVNAGVARRSEHRCENHICLTRLARRIIPFLIDRSKR